MPAFILTWLTGAGLKYVAMALGVVLIIAAYFIWLHEHDARLLAEQIRHERELREAGLTAVEHERELRMVADAHERELRVATEASDACNSARMTTSAIDGWSTAIRSGLARTAAGVTP